MYHIVTIWRVPPQLINQKMSFWLMGSIHTANLGIAGIALTASNRRNPNHHWIANPQGCLDLLKEAPKIRYMFWIDSTSSGFPVRKINFRYIYIYILYIYIHSIYIYSDPQRLSFRPKFATASFWSEASVLPGTFRRWILDKTTRISLPVVI
jgi:hypothetical protein